MLPALFRDGAQGKKGNRLGPPPHLQKGSEKMFLKMFQRDRLLLIFRYRQYQLFFTGYLVTSIGNSMQLLANSWLALVLSGSPVAVAYMFIASALPGVLLSPFIGVMVDRFDRRWIIAITDTARALILFGLFFLGIHGTLQVWHLYVMAFLLSLGDAIYTPSAIAMLREEVPQDVLLYTHSYNGIARQVGGIAGAALAGILIATVSPYSVLCVNAFTFLISVVSVLGIRKGYKSPAKPSQDGKKVHRVRAFANDLLDGLKFIRGRSDVIILYSVITVILSLLSILNVAIAIFVKNVLKSDVTVMSYMEAAFAIGSVVGNIIITAIADAKGITRTMSLGVWALVLALVLLAFSFNPVMAILSYFLVGGTLPVWLLYLTSVQKIVPDYYQGRVSTTFSTCLSVISLLIFFGLSYLVGTFSVRTLYVLQVFLLIIPCILVYKYIYKKGELKDIKDVEEKETVVEINEAAEVQNALVNE
jgi:DHA3 family macrolide efflux protein-like MFS transporter